MRKNMPKINEHPLKSKNKTFYGFIPVYTLLSHIMYYFIHVDCALLRLADATFGHFPTFGHCIRVQPLLTGCKLLGCIWKWYHAFRDFVFGGQILTGFGEMDDGHAYLFLSALGHRSISQWIPTWRGAI